MIGNNQSISFSNQFLRIGAILEIRTLKPTATARNYKSRRAHHSKNHKSRDCSYYGEVCAKDHVRSDMVVSHNQFYHCVYSV